MRVFYYIFFFLLMAASGYFIVKNPNIQEQISSSFFNIKGRNQNVVITNYREENKNDFFLNYIENTVIINAIGMSYKAEINIPLRFGDEVMTAHKSYAVLSLMPNNFVKIYPSSKIRIDKIGLSNSSAKRILLTQEKGLAIYKFDTHQSNDLLMIKTPYGNFVIEDAVFAIHRSKDYEKYFISVNKGEVKYIDSNNGTHSIKNGNTMILSKNMISEIVPRKWSKNYTFTNIIKNIDQSNTIGTNTWALKKISKRKQLIRSKPPVWNPSWTTAKPIPGKKSTKKHQTEKRPYLEAHSNTSISDHGFLDGVKRITNSKEYVKSVEKNLDQLEKD